jgi:predicted adenylyl cyclase CyaB
MQNVEIKARYGDLARAQEIVLAIGAKFSGELRQIDTYFKVNHGRLKLREINSREAQLIFYERPNEAEARLSDYQILPVGDPASFKTLLTSALGIWKVVEKKRLLYWFENVRIHLDSVTGLGDFIEFEGIVEFAGEKENVRQKVERLMQDFAISSPDLIGLSYSDLMA